MAGAQVLTFCHKSSGTHFAHKADKGAGCTKWELVGPGGNFISCVSSIQLIGTRPILSLETGIMTYEYPASSHGGLVDFSDSTYTRRNISILCTLQFWQIASQRSPLGEDCGTFTTSLDRRPHVQGLARAGNLTHSPATEAGWLNYRDWSGKDAQEPFQKSCGSGQKFCPVETNLKLNLKDFHFMN